MSEQDNKTFEADGTRPIQSSAIEVADTFEEDGIRPIAQSPSFLVKDNQNQKKHPVSEDSLDVGKIADKTIEVDGQRPVDSSEVKVVDTFEDDGTRPIMADKYKVVGTLDIDGERPITSK